MPDIIDFSGKTGKAIAKAFEPLVEKLAENALAIAEESVRSRDEHAKAITEGVNAIVEKKVEDHKREIDEENARRDEANEKRFHEVAIVADKRALGYVAEEADSRKKADNQERDERQLADKELAEAIFENEEQIKTVASVSSKAYEDAMRARDNDREDTKKAINDARNFAAAIAGKRAGEVETNLAKAIGEEAEKSERRDSEIVESLGNIEKRIDKAEESSALPSNGVDGQFLMKNSKAQKGASWENIILGAAPVSGGGSGAVDSVNGQTGTVVLDYEDVGALATSPNHIPMNTAPTGVPTTEGTLSWNATDHTLNIQSEIADSVLQVGQEQWVRIVNKTGATITDGQCVYISGAQGNRPTAALADADNSTADKVIGLATADIANNAEGYITIGGIVRGYDTSGFSEGDMLYVSQTAGALTNVAPTAPAHANVVGIALNSTNNGSVLVAISRGTELTSLHDVSMSTAQSGDAPALNASGLYTPFRAVDATGFENRTDSAIAMNGNNLEISKTGSGFNVFVLGRRLNYTATQSKEITADTDETYVYFDANGIQSTTTPWNIDDGVAPAAIVYKNGANYVVFEERHGYKRNRAWHEWAHDTIGTRYESGLAGTFTDTTFSVATGIIHDEDIEVTISGTQTAGRLWYRNTGAGSMAFTDNRTVPYAGSTSQAQYDNSGTLTNVDNAKFVNTWVYATNATTYPIALVAGQNQYATIALARNASLPALPALTTREWKLLYRVTYQQGAGTVTYVEAQDFREVSTGPGSSYTPASHTALTDRDATASHPATAISNTPAGNIEAVTVQAAINELDSEKLAATGTIAGATSQAQSFGANGIKADVIAESTETNGVAVDGLTIKDSGLALGSDADGDIYYRASGALARLAKGTAAQVLTMNAGATAPEWAAAAAGGSGFNWTTDNEVTTDQSPATTDLGERYIYTSSTAAARTVTLPSVTDTEDGKWLAITNASAYMIYVTAADSDYIGWPALKVLSIECLPNTHIVLRYDHSRTRWDLVYKTGAGQVRPTGTKLYLRNTRIADGNVRETTRRHVVTATGAVIGAGIVNAIGLSFDGSDDYVSVPDSADWDVFGATTGAATVCGWVYCDDAAGAYESFCRQYQDGNNTWGFYRLNTGALGLFRYVSGSSDIDISGGSLAQNTWHHVAMCRVGAETGVYIDGVQVGYDATFTAGTFAGSLLFGQAGDGSQYFDGRMDDWCIVHSNIFGAAPNSTPNDTITIDTLNPLGLVI